MHVFKEMYELVQVIHNEGFPIELGQPELKGILFGELFNVSQLNFLINCYEIRCLINYICICYFEYSDL